MTKVEIPKLNKLEIREERCVGGEANVFQKGNEDILQERAKQLVQPHTPRGLVGFILSSAGFRQSFVTRVLKARGVVYDVAHSTL